MRLLVVIVAFQSASVLKLTLRAVANQLDERDTLCVVNNAREEAVANLVNQLETRASVQFISNEQNLGFTGGNNIGLRLGRWQDHEAVLLLNPDLLLPENWIDNGLALLASRPELGIVSGPLVKYCFVREESLDVVDSLGIQRRGLAPSWKDLGQGQSADSTLASYPRQWSPDAVCGALMLIPRAAFTAVAQDGNLFDDAFFAYKEDIDLSLRMRKAGFRLLIDQALLAYHGRGWNLNRSEVPYSLRKLSSVNEVYLHYKHRSPYVIFSLLKMLYVRTIEKFRNHL